MINKSFILLLLIAFNQIIFCNDEMYNLILHSHDRGAYCLDGSPAGMYLHEGKG